MAAQLCSQRRVAVFRVGISAVALLLILAMRERAIATPVYAQPYGTACLTQKPVFNAFGRHILDDGVAPVLGQLNGAGQGRLPNLDVDLRIHALHDGGGRWGRTFNYMRGETLSQAEYLANATGVSAFGSPSLRCDNTTATDGNPGYLSPFIASNPMRPAGSTVSSWQIGSARQTVERDHGTVDFTYYQTNQAPGGIGVTRLIPPTGVQTGGGPGFSYVINPYTRFYTTVYLQNQRPALSILMRFKPQLWSHLK